MTKVAIACGGTGGHIYPALALAERFEASFPGVQTRFFVSGSERCRKMMAGYRGRVDFVGGRGMPASASPAALLFALSFVKGFILGIVSLLKDRPHVVLGMGGYGSAPLVLAARVVGLPAVIHEQNLVPGRANAFLSRFASRVALSFPFIPRRMEGKKAVVTGNPVRRRIGAWEKGASRSRLGLDAQLFTVLVMGGSRGARFLNGLGVACAASLPRGRFQWIHISGEDDSMWVDGRYREIGARYWCGAFTDEIEVLYGAADMAICRAGATTIAELARCGLPALFVPYPHAVGAHQSLNAEYLAGRGAAVFLEQESAEPRKVCEIVSRLEGDRGELSAMGLRLKDIFVADASRRLGDVVLELAERGKK